MGSLTHTNGSAVVRIGDTAAVCGVRAEVLHTDDIASWSVSRASSTGDAAATDTKTNKEDNADYDDDDDDDDDKDPYIEEFNLLVPNLSLSTGCAPGFIPNAAPSALAQSLSYQLLSLLHSSKLVRAKDLTIWYEHPDLSMGEEHNQFERMDTEEEEHKATSTEREIKAFWVLYIDVMFISLAGNPFDTAWASILAALKDTKLPKAWWDMDNETVVCSDDASEAHELSLRGLPVSSSFAVFEADAAAAWRAVVIPDAEELTSQKGPRRRWILADPDGYEESLSQERVCIVVDKEQGEDGKTVLLKMEKNGGWNVGRDELKELVDISARRWKDVNNVLSR